MNAPHHRYFLLNKPCNMVSQFVSADKVGLLGDARQQFVDGIIDGIIFDEEQHSDLSASLALGCKARTQK